MLKKILPYVMMMSLLLVGLAGCQGNSTTTASGTTTTTTKGTTVTSETKADQYFYDDGLPITKEVIELSILFPRSVSNPDSFDDMWFVKEMEKKTNIRLVYKLVEAEAWDERKHIMIASDDYCDLFTYRFDKTDEMTYGGDKGILVDLSDLIYQYAPNVVEVFDMDPVYKKELTAPDGSIYSVTTHTDTHRTRTYVQTFINKQWLDNLGLEMPTDLDQLYTVLKAFKDGDPNQNGLNDEIPWSARYGSSREYGSEVRIMAALGFVNRKHDLVNDQYIFVPVQPAYKEYLIYMNRLFKEGLLDPEYFTQDAAQLNLKITEMKIGWMEASPSNLLVEASDYEQYVTPGPWTSSINSQPMICYTSGGARATGLFVMTDKCKYPEAAVRLLDYTFSKEGSVMVRCGPEYGWEGGDGGGWELYVNDDGVETTRLHYLDQGFTSFWNYRSLHTPLQFAYQSHFGWIDFIVMGADPRNQFSTDALIESGLLNAGRSPYPDLFFTQNEYNEMATIQTDIYNYIEEMDAKFISGDMNINDHWDAYLTTLENMGVKRLIDIRQAAYDRWK